MSRRILVIVGHPDPDPARLCRGLAAAYAEGARAAGHAVKEIDIAGLDFPLLATRTAFRQGALPPGLADAAEAVVEAEHIVLVFPLWFGTMPAAFKGFLEQVMRPGVAFEYPKEGESGLPRPLLKGHSARIVVTMDTPAPLYRFWFFDHGVAVLRRNILNFTGIAPVRETLLGTVTTAGDAKRRKWLGQMRVLGGRAA